MRAFFTFLHRWVGLATAAFLFIAGVTGAVITWDRELDEWLNPHLTQVETSGPALPALELARIIEARDSSLWATYIPMHVEEGKSFSLFVRPRIDPATGAPYTLDFNQIFVDPATGEEIGKRQWGAVWPVTTENLMSFLYVLHYTLHLPDMWGIDHWGLWLMGGVSLLWTIDCFVGFYLTLPARRRERLNRAPSVARQLSRSWWARWVPAWKVKTRGSPYRINFDLHRAFGLWTWGLLFVVAFTGVTLNLYREVFYPVLTTFAEVTPSPFAARERDHDSGPVMPGVGFPEVIAKARAEAGRRNWTAPVGVVFYRPEYGLYGIQFNHPGEDHGTTGITHRLYYDGSTGELAGDRTPWTGTAGDIFAQAQYPVHSGRILGLPGRIAVSILGVVVAVLSVTGVVIWHRKRRARVLKTFRRQRRNRSSDGREKPTRGAAE